MNDTFEDELKLRSNNYPALTSRLLALSVAEDYEDAKLEWRITGHVWKKTPHGRYRDIIINHACGHPYHCLCGKDIVYHFEIENTENQVKEIVGSTCINNWMVLRHMSETLNISISSITEEKIEEWKKVAVETLIREAWWDDEGEEFTEIFNEVKDLDLRLNVKTTSKKYYDVTLKEWRPVTYLRKSGSGKFGRKDYQMASIVWRWNHPDNTRAQNIKRGYPNDKLIKDLNLFSLLVDDYVEKLQLEDQYVIDRGEFLANLDLEVKDRVKKLMDNDISERKFLEACFYFGYPIFDSHDDGENNWERTFLRDMKRVFILGGEPSEKQAERLKDILLTRPNAGPTDKQLNYLRDLGYSGRTDILTRRGASEVIRHMRLGFNATSNSR
mgnify:CR=1 FL=1